MLILKGFYRKKVVRIYLIIFTLIFISLLFVNNSRNYYKELIDDYNKRYFIVLTTEPDELEKLNSLPNIKKITRTITDNWRYLVKDEEGILKEDEILVNNIDKLDYKINDVITLDYDNNVYNFKIKDFFPDINIKKYIINAKLFDELCTNTLGYTYLIEFENYDKRDILYKAIDKNIDYKIINTTSNRPQNSQIDTFETFKSLLTILQYVLSAIFGVVAIITIYNVLVDEFKSSYLYSCLGYSKKKIKKYNIIKLFSLLLFSLSLSLIIFFIITLIYKVK